MVSTTLSSIIDGFRELTVTVIGDAILDSYFSGRPLQLSREAPVPTVVVENHTFAAGGAANAAINAADLGARVRFVSAIGSDRDGTRLSDILSSHGINTEYLIKTDARRTLIKSRIIASSQMLIRFDQGSTALLDKTTEDRLLAELPKASEGAGALILSDYGCGLFSPTVVKAVSRLRRESPLVLVVDSRTPARFRTTAPAAVKPNYEEAVSLLGIQPSHKNRAGQIAAFSRRLLELTGARVCAVTLDSEGAVVLEKDAPPYRTYARSAETLHATGAGDTFTVTLALALASKAETTEAAELASYAASVVTAKEITASCSAGELKARIAAENKFIPDTGSLAALCALYRSQGKRVVFTNGCFDILHRGHIVHLNRSKGLADVLIVGVNSDAGVARLKGAGRPLASLEDRVQVLSALSCVDHITVFEQNTSEELIRAIRPEVFTKGADYSVERLPEAPLLGSMGSRIVIFPRLGQYSTEGILRHIREETNIP